MAAAEQTSLRLDKALLQRIDEMAKRLGETRTDVVDAALRWWTATEGGRGLAGSFVPPGLTEKFDRWLEKLTSRSQVTLLVLDPEGGAPWAYSGELWDVDLVQAQEAGVFLLRVELPNAPPRGESTIPVPIPRGLIAAFTEGGEKLTKPLLISLWSARDGNARAVGALAAENRNAPR